MKNIIFVSILLLNTFVINSQVAKLNLPPNSTYRNVNVTLNDFNKYEGMKVYIDTDSISFIDINTNKFEKIALSNVDYLRVKEGNQALKWAGFGALFMGLSAVIATLEYPGYYSGDFVMGFTLSGAAIGGLIGLAVPKWKTYYLDY